VNGWLILLALAVLAATYVAAVPPVDVLQGVQPQRQDRRPGAPVDVRHLPGLRRPGPRARDRCPRVLQPRRARRMTAARANH